jgi:uncharacterized protein involved in exopolysaccharide biosynthesis
MELKRYFALARRWAWLGILGLLLGAAGGYFYSAQQTPLYQASTRFVILKPRIIIRTLIARILSRRILNY